MRLRCKCGVAMLLFLLGMTACGSVGEQEEKVTITVLADDSVSNMDLYRTKLAAKFPDVKFEFSFQSNMEPELELNRRVAHGDVADLFFSKYLNVDIEGLADCFMDLSGKSYTSRYQTSYLNSLDVDGHIYYLPADMAVEGMIYYQTLFEKHDLEVPANYEEFAALCAQLKELGLRPGVLLTGSQAPAELFSRFYALDKKNDLSAWQWAESFSEGGALAREGKLESTLDILSAYAELGLLAPEDFTASRSYGRHFLVDRKSAMLFGNGAVPYEMINRTNVEDFRIMPIFSPVDGKGYFFVVPLFSLAVGRQVAEDPRKEEAVDRILSYITSEEGQADLMSFDYGVISPISGLRSLEGETFYQDAVGQMTEGAMLQLTQFPNCKYILNSSLGAYLDGKMTQTDLIALLDAAGKTEGLQRPVLAQAAVDFTLEETNTLALEAMNQALNTDAALLRRGTSGQRPALEYTIRGKIYQGAFTAADLSCIYPVQESVEQQTPMLRVKMTAEKLLEQIGVDGTYFYRGVSVRYEWDKAVGAYRAAALLNAENQEIAPEAVLTVAMMAQEPFIKEKYEQWEQTEVTLWAALLAYVEECGILNPCEVNPAVYEEK